MQPWNGIKVHPKNSADHCCRRHQAGYYCHHLHYLVHFQVNIVEVEVMHVDHHITISFTQIICLYDVIINVFKIFGASIIKQVAIAANKTIDKISDRAIFLFKTISSLRSWLIFANDRCVELLTTSSSKSSIWSPRFSITIK